MVTVAASNNDIPVLTVEVLIASIPPPNSRIRLAMCIEKSTPTPTKIDPIITVTSDRETSICHITSHCNATVAITGAVVHNENLISLNTIARVIKVRTTAKPKDDHWLPTINSLTAMAVAATPVKSPALIFPS